LIVGATGWRPAMKEENGPLIALVVFIVLSLVFGIMAYQDKKEVEGNAADKIPSKQQLIDDEQAEVERLKEDIESKKYQIAGFRKAIQKTQDDYDFYAEALEDYTVEYTRRLKLKEAAEAYNTQGATLADQVSTLKSKTLTTINGWTSKAHEEMDAEVTDKTKAQAAAVGRKNQIDEELVTSNKKHAASMNYEKSRRDETKQTLSDLTQRDVERATVLTEADGKIVYADDVHNILVIDIGSSAGVRNGFRFEVYAMRPGKKKVSKGYLEVIRADPTKSQCKFLNKLVPLPKDSLSEYVGAQPEEMYSPYQQSGNKDATASAMTSARPSILGFDIRDPIVEGDLVQNPFFSPGKNYTFYVAGLKELDKDSGRQKSAIKYRWTEIKAVAERYGGKVVNDVDIDVNYMIAQKDPTSDDKYVKGVDLGIPVIYEWELFRFLDNR
jgi:hypothetical protein